MPTRILREGILDSKAVNSVSEEAELLYRRLYSIVDDYGRCECDSDLIRARAFPRQMERWDAPRINRVLRELTVDHGYSPLITVYKHGDRIVLEISKFRQRCQTKPRFPGPLDEGSVVDPRWITVDHGESPLSRVESKSNVEHTGKVEVLHKTEVFSPPTPSEKELREVSDAFDRHQCFHNLEPKDLIVQQVISMNGKFDWKRFRSNHAAYCAFWSEKGWNFCRVTFMGWINAGMPGSPETGRNQERSNLPNVRELKERDRKRSEGCDGDN